VTRGNPSTSPSFSFPPAVTPGDPAAEARGFLARAAAGISMSAGLFMVRNFVCYANHPNAPMLQECHLIGSVRLEAMITIAPTEERRVPPAAAIAMTVLFVVNIPPA
jgi:hypothetical protein